MLRLTFVLLLFIAFSACRSPQKLVSKSGEIRIHDVIYGPFKSNKMDVYLPANTTKETPVVVVIHGGGWKVGTKKWDRPTQDSLLAHGIASINIDYRFTNSKNIHYAQLIEDVDNAVNCAINHADEWHTRKENFIMTGHSAGAHLALLYAFTTNKKIGAIIAQAAPSNLADTVVLNYFYDKPEIIKVANDMAGTKYVKGQPLAEGFRAASPIFHVKNIPTLLIHGTHDEIVPYTQSIELEKVLKAKNVTYKLVTLPNARHDMNIKDDKTRKFIYKEVVDWILMYGH